MTSLVFEFETGKAQLMSTQERILDAVDRVGIGRVSDELLPEVEILDKVAGPYFKYQLRVPLEQPVDEEIFARVVASVPVGVQVRAD